MSEVTETERAGTGSEPSSDGQDSTRQGAIDQIQRTRRFHVELAASGIAMGVLVVIWALGEYHNAGGWPTGGFSQSSGIHDVWNYWIVYPLMAWILIMAARAWTVYRHRSISEQDIAREIDRQSRDRRR